MKRVVLVFWIVFSVNLISAQIYVKGTSYIFNKGTVVYSKGNLELNGASSNFYLRNEGQFLQGTTGTSTNLGLGKFSVFQEGTVNNYAYNYWCSPVGNASTTVGNEDFGITMLNVPTSNISSTAATITSASYNGSSSAGALTIASYWIFKFLSQANYSGWVQSAATTNISAGQGFTMKGASGSDATNVGETALNNPGSAQRYDFRGKPNDGNITVNVATNNYTLTGNPYPSALHVNAFLLDATNTACTGIAYYWEQDKTVNSHVLLAYKGGYGTYSPVSLVSTGIYVPATFDTYTISGTINTTGSSSGLVISRKYAPIGQGFMVKGASNGSITLMNSHRFYYKESTLATSHFEKFSNSINQTDNQSDTTVSHIRLNTSFNGLYTRQIALAFVGGATDGVDRGIDAESPAGADLANDSYFVLQNGKYVIQGIEFDTNKRLPLGLKITDNTTVKFDLADEINFDSNQDVFIYDSLDNSYHNLKTDGYSVTLSTGVYNDRFQLTFKSEALSVIHPIKDNVIVFQDNANQQMVISNPNLLDIKTVVLYDISGKQLFEKTNLQSKSSYEFSTSSFSDGVYLVKIQSSDGQSFGQKIIVSSK
ncbi:T9SS type A sorting domain-containing protein [Flavobacterium sp. N1994]|uniref:T9SS type A sorting domain-containing protein n=1 Tax=Flavobacterium sp. N1994 TaxID=2986827 RepID=UPI0022239D5F|nr:T9SS type A sorting domain-containing protein [Flavobacterium sp. N1994]